MQRRHLAVVLACLAATGCSDVSSSHPVGEPVTADVAKRLEGVWLTEDGEPAWVRHLGDNELRVAGISWNKEESRFKLDELQVFVTTDEERGFVNLRELGGEGPAAMYFICRCGSLEGESLVFYLPNAEAFIAAVESGSLPGKVEQREFSKSVKLAADSKQLSEFVSPAKFGEQFQDDAPIILHRVQQVEEDVER